MPRRRSFGPKRKSFGKGLRLNTKGGIPTSVSVGGRGFRVNASGRGVRTTTRNPITGTRYTSSSGNNRQSQQVIPASLPNDASTQKKKGCMRGCLPFFAIVVIVLLVALLLM